jgi:hypothetical protein
MHLYKFGSLVYKHVPKNLRTNLDKHAQPYIFMGYYSTSKAYRLLELSTKKIIIARDVVFLKSNMSAINIIDPRTNLNVHQNCSSMHLSQRTIPNSQMKKTTNPLQHRYPEDHRGKYPNYRSRTHRNTRYHDDHRGNYPNYRSSTNASV